MTVDERSSEIDDLVELNDRRLERLIRSGGSTFEVELEGLLEQADPLIDTIIGRYTRARGLPSRTDGEDVKSATHLRLISKLRRTATSKEDAIADFLNYVATLTYNGLNDHLRRLYPARTRLKNRLRYTLKHDRRLAIWMTEGVVAAGLSAWEGSPEPLPAVPLNAAEATGTMRNADRAGDALVALFRQIGHPVDLEALLSFTSDVWNIADDEMTPAHELMISVEGTGADVQTELRQYLHALWPEIRELPVLQRRALLLNLRSTNTVNVLSLIVVTGTASFDDVAMILGIPPDELAAFWNDLPLDDLRIATMLNMNRQQVINLRKAARERLTRRMSRFIARK